MGFLHQICSDVSIQSGLGVSTRLVECSEALSCQNVYFDCVVSVPRYILSLCGVSVSRYICFFLCQDPYSDTITACCFIVRIYTK